MAMRYFNDDGTEFNPDLIPLPDLCASCAKRDEPDQEVLCNLTRAEARGEDIFVCFAYTPNSLDVDREAVLRDLCARAGIDYPEEDRDDPDDPETIHF